MAAWGFMRQIHSRKGATARGGRTTVRSCQVSVASEASATCEEPCAPAGLRASAAGGFRTGRRDSVFLRSAYKAWFRVLGQGLVSGCLGDGMERPISRSVFPPRPAHCGGHRELAPGTVRQLDTDSMTCALNDMESLNVMVSAVALAPSPHPILLPSPARMHVRRR